MAVPKWKTSKTKTRMRRANGYYRLELMQLTPCPQCQQQKRPHHVCPHCGFYRGKQVLTAARAEVLSEGA